MTAPFNRYSCCKKCGAPSNAIGTRWVQLLFGGDAIQRTCGRCGYVWNEATLDRKAPAPLHPP